MAGSRPFGADETLGLVDFVLFPHLGHEDLPHNTMPNAEKWAAGMSVPGYALDDETAIKAVDSSIDVVSERNWKLFAPLYQAARLMHGRWRLAQGR